MDSYWFRYTLIMWSSNALMGCALSGKSPTPSLLQVQPQALQAPPLEIDLDINGRLTLNQLSRTLTLNGIQLTYPPDRAATPIDFTGPYDADRLAETLETTLACEVIRVGPSWSLVWDAGAWSVVTPRLANEQLPGVQARNIGGRWVYSGDPGQLPSLRRIVQTLARPRTMARFRCVITDDSRSWAFGLDHPQEGVDFGFGALALSFDTLVTAAAEASAVVTEFEALLTDGVDWEYSDTVERRVPNYGVDDAGNIRPTTFETVSAGLTLTTWAAYVDGNWRMSGSIGISDFIGSTSEDLATSGRSTRFDLDLAPGGCVRLVRLGDKRQGTTLGIAADTLGASGTASRRSWSVWISVEPVPMAEPAIDPC